MPLRTRFRKFVALYLLNLGHIIGVGVEKYEADRKREREERTARLRQEARLTGEKMRAAQRAEVVRRAVTRTLVGLVHPDHVGQIVEDLEPNCLVYQFGEEFAVCGPDGADLGDYLPWFVEKMKYAPLRLCTPRYHVDCVTNRPFRIER